MKTLMKPLALPKVTIERPGWIPSEITHDWDVCPYAYQTEEELMPAGGLHGQFLAYMMEVLRDALQKRGLMFLMDVFMLYRDKKGIKQRIGPDLLLMPYRFPPPSSYDLDVEPPPLCVVEVTSPSSHLSDLEKKVDFYLNLGIPTYLAIDAITPHSQPRSQIELHVWRSVGGQAREMRPDAQGGLALPEMGLKILAHGQQISFVDLLTGEYLFDTTQLLTVLRMERQAHLSDYLALQKERQARLDERQARLKAEAQAKSEALARFKAELERNELKAKMAKSMLQEGVDLTLVARVTGLSVEELAELHD